MRHDLEYAYRRSLDDGTKGCDIGGQPLSHNDLQMDYPLANELNGVALITTHFPHLGVQEKLLKYYHHWLRFVRRNETSPLAGKIREELKKLCDTEKRELDLEVYREFAFMMSRSYLLCILVTHKLLGKIIQAYANHREANVTEEISFEDYLNRATPGGWFFSTRQLTYLNVLRRCHGARNGEILGLRLSVHQVIPYTAQEDCPRIQRSNVLKVLPPSLKNYVH